MITTLADKDVARVSEERGVARVAQSGGVWLKLISAKPSIIIQNYLGVRR